MSNVFISYRREDSSASAGRIFDRLRDYFGQEHVFRDIDTLAPGADFAKIIRERIGACNSLIAVIGTDWFTVADANGQRRLDDAGDLVKAEIREALDGNKLVIPALVNGARMPRKEDLSVQIAALAERNAIEISESRFDYDVERLIEAVEQANDSSLSTARGPGAMFRRLVQRTRNPGRQRTLIFVGGSVALLVLAAYAAYGYLNDKPRGRNASTVVSGAPGSVVAGGNVTASASPGGTAIVAGGSVTIGITVEQYETGLKRRELEIRSELARAGGGDTQQLAQLQGELGAVQARSQDLEKSLADSNAKLVAASQTLEKLKGGVPSAELKQAKQSLANGDTAAAEALFAKTLEAGKAEAAESAFQLGELAYRKVDYGKAYTNYIEAARLQPDNADFLNMAGRIALDSGRYVEAQTYLENALAIRRKSLEPNDRKLASSLNNLAMLYKIRGLYAKAEPLYQEALAIRKQSDSSISDVAMALNNLALLYKTEGQYAKAEPLYLETLAIQRKALGVDDPDVATALNNLAALYKAETLYAKAAPLYQEALAIRRKVLGPDHPAVAESLNNLAELTYRQGMYAEAEPLYKEALAIQRKSLGPDHPAVATSLNNLAELFRAQHLDAQAESLYQEALVILEKSLGADHPDVAIIVNNQALLYQAQGLDAKAEPLYQRALKILQEKLPPDHPILATVMGNYADCLAKLKRPAEAKQWQSRADQIRQQHASQAKTS